MYKHEGLSTKYIWFKFVKKLNIEYRTRNIEL